MGGCSTIVAFLLDYIEGRLPAATRAELETHLAGCPSCVAHVRTYRTTVDLLRSLRDEDLPPELRATVHGFLDHRAVN